MDNRIRLGLIGAGVWGKNYIKTINKRNDLELKWLSCLNEDILELIDSNCIYEKKWNNLPARNEIDGIIVAAPAFLHYEMVSTIVKHGFPVIVEKPLTVDKNEAYNLLDLVSGIGEPLFLINHIHLYSNAFRKLIELKNNYGNMKRVVTNAGNWGPFRQNTPMLWDWAPHDIAMCLELFETLPDSVEVLDYNKKTDHDKILEDIKIRLLFSGDIETIIELGNNYNTKKREFYVYYENEILLYDDISDNKLKELKSDTVFNVDMTKTPLDILLDEFSMKIRGKVFDYTDLELGVKIIDVIDMIDRNVN